MIESLMMTVIQLLYVAVIITWALAFAYALAFAELVPGLIIFAVCGFTMMWGMNYQSLKLKE